MEQAGARGLTRAMRLQGMSLEKGVRVTSAQG
jgi:hypothetical protein